jgi:hypothetical protein
MEGPARPRNATPLAHAQRPAARSAAEPDTRLRSRCPGAPCVRGMPPGWCPFSVVRDFYARGQSLRKGLTAGNFTTFPASTKCPQLAGSYPPQPRIRPQQIHSAQARPLGLPPARGCSAGKAPACAPARTAPTAAKHRAEDRQAPGPAASITTTAQREPSREPTIANIRPHSARPGVRSIHLTSHRATVSDIELRRGSPSHRGDQRARDSSPSACGGAGSRRSSPSPPIRSKAQLRRGCKAAARPRSTAKPTSSETRSNGP